MTDIDDLQRVLGYVDAIDDSTDIAAVGPDLYAGSFWTPQFCSAIIRAAEAVGAFEPQPDDPVPGHEVSLAVLSPRLFEHVQADIKLNDNYEGADLEFPLQGFSNGSMPVGSVLAWPSLVTHPHQTNQLVSGVKYALTIWCELPAYVA